MSNSFSLVDKNGAAPIILGKSRSQIEQHAAEELSRYIELITNAKPKIIRVGDEFESGAVIIGRPQTNEILAEFVEKGLIQISDDTLGLDGFVVKTVEDGGKRFLVLSGSADRSTLYAVYDFLERFCRVGFFWDHEYVPKSSELTFGEIDIAQKPYFEFRQNLQACVIGYSATYWSKEEWRREIDWMAKHKYNALHLCLGGRVARYETFKMLDIKDDEPSQVDKAHAEIAKHNSEYAKSLGMDVVTPQVFCGAATPAMKERYPNAKYFDMQWFNYDPQPYIHPGDPLFKKVLIEWLKQYDNLYKTTGYYNIDPYAESEPPGEPEERAEIKASFGRAVSEAVKAVNPNGKWVMSGWGFVERDFWPIDHIKAMLDAIPDDILILNDFTSNYTTSAGLTRIYEETDYYFGKVWGWTIFHSFGGNTHLHGDVHSLLENAHRVAAEPKAKNCKAFYMTPEIVRHNSFYFDLANKLGWNPTSISDIQSYTADYAERRYGKASAGKMTECLTELVNTVYSWYDMNDFHGPIYQLSPTLVDRAWWEKRTEFVPSLGRALKIALSIADEQHGNKCYERDLVDIAKEYVGCCVTKFIIEMKSAAIAKDEQKFQTAADKAVKGLNAIEEMVHLLPEYHISKEIEDSTKPPYSMDAKETAVSIRTRYTILIDFEHYDTLLDYARRDMYELVKFYYKPRVEWMISYLQSCLKTGKEPVEQELHDGCIPIAKSFIYDSPILEAPKSSAADVAAHVKKSLERAELMP